MCNSNELIQSVVAKLGNYKFKKIAPEKWAKTDRNWKEEKSIIDLLENYKILKKRNCIAVLAGH